VRYMARLMSDLMGDLYSGGAGDVPDEVLPRG
jgi:hypothetical protein